MLGSPFAGSGALASNLGVDGLPTCVGLGVADLEIADSGIGRNSVLRTRVVLTLGLGAAGLTTNDVISRYVKRCCQQRCRHRLTVNVLIQIKSP